MDDFRPVPLAEGFPDADEQDWRALVEKALKGAPFERLVSRSDDGIEIRPLYTRRDIAIERDPSGFPGLAPHLRGAKADERGFALLQRVDHPDPAIARRQALRDLARGVDGLVLVIDDGRPIGDRPEGVVLGLAPERPAEVGERLAGLLEDVRLDLAPVVLEAGAAGLAVARAFVGLLEECDTAADAPCHDLGLDPLAQGACAGFDEAAVETLVAGTIELAQRLDGEGAVRARPLRLSGRVWHDAGASEAQELAILLANGVFWLRRLEVAGIPPERAAPFLGFHLMADADLMFTIARLRAMRALWRRILAACGVVGTRRHEPHLSAETAPRMFSRCDPWVNILRATVATQGALLGGARAVTVRHHLDALAPGDELARRIARNIPIILTEESHLRQVMDVAGGSFAIERLTRALAERAWNLFREIEGAGGLDRALAQGTVQEWIVAMAERRRRMVATRRRPITGVSEYPNLAEVPPEGLPADRVALREKTEQGRFGPWRTGDGDAARDDARPPLRARRLAEDFEAFRAASDRILAESGARPRIFLANLGPIARHNQRAAFAKNAFEAGGIEAVANDGFEDARTLARAFAESGAKLAVICGHDDDCAEMAEDVAGALKAAGARIVWLAGRAPDDGTEAAWRRAGIDRFIARGTDMIAQYGAAFRALGLALPDEVRDLVGEENGS